jgi:hypothetical protein
MLAWRPAPGDGICRTTEIVVASSPIKSPQQSESRIELARRLYREFYAACFWHLKPDLVVTEEVIPIILHGLRTHGGRRGLLAAAQLEEREVSSDECR